MTAPGALIGDVPLVNPLMIRICQPDRVAGGARCQPDRLSGGWNGNSFDEVKLISFCKVGGFGRGRYGNIGTPPCHGDADSGRKSHQRGLQTDSPARSRQGNAAGRLTSTFALGIEASQPFPVSVPAHRLFRNMGTNLEICPGRVSVFLAQLIKASPRAFDQSLFFGLHQNMVHPLFQTHCQRPFPCTVGPFQRP